MQLARIILFSLPLALCSCAVPAERMSFSPSPKLYAWDGSGRDPNQRRPKARPAKALADEENSRRTREQTFASLRPYSAAWWSIHDAIEADHDKRLARKLVICTGCLRPSQQ